MKKLSLLVLVLFATVSLGIVQGCKQPDVSVTGKWTEVDGSDTVEFTPSGTYSANLVYDADGFNKTIAGKYSVSEDKITLTANDDPKDSMVLKVTLADNILAVTYQQGGRPKLDGSKARFRRAN